MSDESPVFECCGRTAQPDEPLVFRGGKVICQDCARKRLWQAPAGTSRTQNHTWLNAFFNRITGRSGKVYWKR